MLFPAHAKTRGDVLLVPDLHARVSLLDKANKPIVHLGDDEVWRKKVLDGFKIRAQPKEWPAGKFVHPHDACLRQGRQHLRRRVGRNRPRDVPEEGGLAGERPGVSGPSLEVPKTRPAYAGPFAILRLDGSPLHRKNERVDLPAYN